MAEAATDKVKQFVLVPGAIRRAPPSGRPARAARRRVYRATGSSPRPRDAVATDELTKKDLRGRRLHRPNQPATETPDQDAARPRNAARGRVPRHRPQGEDLQRRVGESAPKKSYGFYDINAWSLPLAYGVEAYWSEDFVPTSSLVPVQGAPKPDPSPRRRAASATCSRGTPRVPRGFVSAL